MQHVEYKFPEIEDIETFDKHEQRELVEQMNALNDYQKRVVEVVLEQKIIQALELYNPGVSKVIVHPTAIREDNGYQFKNAMIWVGDWEDPSQSHNYSNLGSSHTAKIRFQAGLDESLRDLAPLMRDIIDFDIPKLKAKYRSIEQNKEAQRHNHEDAHKPDDEVHHQLHHQVQERENPLGIDMGRYDKPEKNVKDFSKKTPATQDSDIGFNTGKNKYNL